MYVLAPNQSVEKYPYTIGNLRRDNPNTSFPRNPSYAVLADWNVFPVKAVDRPDVDYTKNVTEGAPELLSGEWVQVWTVTNASEQEIAVRLKGASDLVRHQRDKMIAETDWMALSDNTLTPAWATYRQALRDITDHVNFPYLQEADWPVKP